MLSRPYRGAKFSKGHQKIDTFRDIDNLLTWYYAARGWNENGIPTKETLEGAGLAKVAEDLENRGLIRDDS